MTSEMCFGQHKQAYVFIQGKKYIQLQNNEMQKLNNYGP